MGDLAEARTSLKRVMHLLSVAYRATKGVDYDPCRGMAEDFGAIIDVIENEIDDAFMLIWDGMSADERELSWLNGMPSLTKPSRRRLRRHDGGTE